MERRHGLRDRFNAVPAPIVPGWMNGRPQQHQLAQVGVEAVGVGGSVGVLRHNIRQRGSAAEDVNVHSQFMLETRPCCVQGSDERLSQRPPIHGATGKQGSSRDHAQPNDDRFGAVLPITILHEYVGDSAERRSRDTDGASAGRDTHAAGCQRRKQGNREHNPSELDAVNDNTTEDCHILTRKQRYLVGLRKPAPIASSWARASPAGACAPIELRTFAQARNMCTIPIEAGEVCHVCAQPASVASLHIAWCDACSAALVQRSGIRCIGPIGKVKIPNHAFEHAHRWYRFCVKMALHPMWWPGELSEATAPAVQDENIVAEQTVDVPQAHGAVEIAQELGEARCPQETPGQSSHECDTGRHTQEGIYRDEDGRLRRVPKQCPSTAKPNLCHVCGFRPREIRFSCGHQVICQSCATYLRSCPLCRMPFGEAGSADGHLSSGEETYSPPLHRERIAQKDFTTDCLTIGCLQPGSVHISCERCMTDGTRARSFLVCMECANTGTTCPGCGQLIRAPRDEQASCPDESRVRRYAEGRRIRSHASGSDGPEQPLTGALPLYVLWNINQVVIKASLKEPQKSVAEEVAAHIRAVRESLHPDGDDDTDIIEFVLTALASCISPEEGEECVQQEIVYGFLEIGKHGDVKKMIEILYARLQQLLQRANNSNPAIQNEAQRALLRISARTPDMSGERIRAHLVIWSLANVVHAQHWQPSEPLCCKFMIAGLFFGGPQIVFRTRSDLCMNIEGEEVSAVQEAALRAAANIIPESNATENQRETENYISIALGVHHRDDRIMMQGLRVISRFARGLMASQCNRYIRIHAAARTITLAQSRCAVGWGAMQSAIQHTVCPLLEVAIGTFQKIFEGSVLFPPFATVAPVMVKHIMRDLLEPSDTFARAMSQKRRRNELIAKICRKFCLGNQVCSTICLHSNTEDEDAELEGDRARLASVASAAVIDIQHEILTCGPALVDKCLPRSPAAKWAQRWFESTKKRWSIGSDGFEAAITANAWLQRDMQACAWLHAGGHGTAQAAAQKQMQEPELPPEKCLAKAIATSLRRAGIDVTWEEIATHLPNPGPHERRDIMQIACLYDVRIDVWRYDPKELLDDIARGRAVLNTWSHHVFNLRGAGYIGLKLCRAHFSSCPHLPSRVTLTSMWSTCPGKKTPVGYIYIYIYMYIARERMLG